MRAAVFALALGLPAHADEAMADRIFACLQAEGLDACHGREYLRCVTPADGPPEAGLRLDCVEAEYRGWQALMDRLLRAAGPAPSDESLARQRAFLAARETECGTAKWPELAPVARNLIAWECRRRLTAERVIQIMREGGYTR